MFWDLYIREYVKIGNTSSVEVWRKRTAEADTGEEIIEKIRALGLRGKFYAYPEDTGVAVHSYVRESVEFERLR